MAPSEDSAWLIAMGVGGAPIATECPCGSEGNLDRLLVRTSRLTSGPSLCENDQTSACKNQGEPPRPVAVGCHHMLVLKRLRSGEEAGILATPSDRTLAASRPATKLLSCQKGPTLELDPVRCRLAANFANTGASTSPHMAVRTRQPLGTFQAKARPGPKKCVTKITKRKIL